MRCFEGKDRKTNQFTNKKKVKMKHFEEKHRKTRFSQTRKSENEILRKAKYDI